MLVGIDSEVTITSMLFIPDPEVRGVMNMQFTYFIDELGPMDQSFNTDLEVAIANKLENVFNESKEGNE